MTEADLADLFERYHRAVHRSFLRVTRRSEDADDLTQDLFVRVSRCGDRYQRQGPGRETVWLFRIALRLVIDRQRKLAGFPVDRVPVEGWGERRRSSWRSRSRRPWLVSPDWTATSSPCGKWSD